MKRPANARLAVAAGFVVVAVVAVGLSWSRSDAIPPAAVAPSPDPVATEAVVRRENLRVTLHLVARTARADVVIEAPADSVLELDFADGANVTAGDRIGRFVSTAHDPADADRGVAEAASALMSAELERGSAVGAAMRALDAARRGIERIRSRSTDDPATPDELIAADAALRQAQADLDDAVARGALAVAQANDLLVRRRADVAAADAATIPVTAPASGLVSRTSPSAASIEVGLVVRAELLPTQLLRMRSGIGTAAASVETTGGKRRVTCAELVTSESAGSTSAARSSTASAVGDAAASTDDGTAGGVLDCRLPSALDTVAGLTATLEVTVDFGNAVPVVPEIAVGFDDEGSPFVVTTAGDRVPVELGPSDGVLRVVRGIEEGTAVELP